MPNAVDPSVRVPEMSEHPISHLNEDLYGGFALGSYDELGERLLRDHIGYPASALASHFSLTVLLGRDLVTGSNLVGDWAGDLMFVSKSP